MRSGDDSGRISDWKAACSDNGNGADSWKDRGGFSHSIRVLRLPVRTSQTDRMSSLQSIQGLILSMYKLSYRSLRRGLVSASPRT